MNLKALELSAMKRERKSNQGNGWKWFVKIISLQFISFSRPKNKKISKAFDKIVAEKFNGHSTQSRITKSQLFN